MNFSKIYTTPVYVNNRSWELFPLRVSAQLTAENGLERLPGGICHVLCRTCSPQLRAMASSDCKRAKETGYSAFGGALHFVIS